MELTAVSGLLAWGTVVGLDLASVAQVMVTRPLVAGVVAGWIVGDVQAGLIVGATLELFAFEVLPFGAARYPDYGLGAVAAVATAAGAPGVLGHGIGVVVGLAVAYMGEVGIQFVRQRNSIDVRRHRAGLDAGDVGVIYRVHLRGIARDATRALLLTAVGLVFALAARAIPMANLRTTVVLAAVAIGIGWGTAVAGGLRIATDKRAGLAWFAMGIAVGLTWVVVR